MSASSSFLRLILSLRPSASRLAAVILFCICSPDISDAISDNSWSVEIVLLKSGVCAGMTRFAVVSRFQGIRERATGGECAPTPQSEENAVKGRDEKAHNEAEPLPTKTTLRGYCDG